MGWFSKVFKGIKKVVKKIGSGIKKVVGKVGKAVGKLGIVGQIGLMFIMPGVGGLLAKGFTSLTGGLLGAAGTGIGATLARGVGHVLSAAGKFASIVGNAYSTVTNGITGFIGNVGGKVLEKVGLKAATEGTVTEAFGSWVNTLVSDTKSILDPWKVTNQEYITGLKAGQSATDILADAKEVSKKAYKAVSNGEVAPYNQEVFTPKQPKFIGGGGEVAPYNQESMFPKNITPEVANSVTEEIASAAAKSQTEVRSVSDWLTDGVQSLATNVRDSVIEAPGKAINSSVNSLVTNQLDHMLGGYDDEYYAETSGRVNPIFSQVQQVDQALQSQGYSYGGNPVLAAQFNSNLSGVPQDYYSYMNRFQGGRA